ncbi:MAG: glycosyltransferase family 4 protein [Promethearchaeota archaeon]
MTKKINVLYVIDNLLIGGAQELVKTLSLNLNRELFNVSVCSLVGYDSKSDKEPLSDEITSGGVDVTTLYMKGWRDKKEKEKFIELLKEKEIDIIHSHLYPTDLWASRLGKSAGVPVRIYTKHDTYHNKFLLIRLRNAFYYNNCVDTAQAISDISEKHLKEYEFVNPSKIIKIYNPVDTDAFNPFSFSGEKVREELGIPLDVPLVGNVSRFVPRKGNEFFIETAMKVLKKNPDCRFFLIGWGEDENKYRDLIKSYGIQDRFIIAVARRDIPEILSAIDIFLFTPLWGESLPITVLEAMSMGKAIIASNVCSNRELVEHEVSGLLPTPEKWSLTANMLEAGRLADSVLRLIDNPALREDFGKQARLRTEKTFGVPVIMKQLEGLYKRLLREKS